MKTVLALLLATAAAGAAHAESLTLLTEENPPLNFTRQGQMAGTGTQVVREMLQRAGMQGQFAVLPWAQAFARAQSEPNTCVYSTVRNPQREKQFQWLGPVSQGIYSVFGLSGFEPAVTRVDELKAYRIAVVNDARAAFLRESGMSQLVEGADDNALPKKLTLDRAQPGGADLWMTQQYGALAKARAAGVEIKPVLRAVLTRQYWLACHPGLAPETYRKLRSALSSMRSDGSFARLSDAEQLPP